MWDCLEEMSDEYMVKISVILCTKRKNPHIEWALESLMGQTYSHNEFEYLVIDGLYGQRKDDINKLIKDMNVDFPVLYLPDKPSRWKGKRPALCNARNTGIIFAKGEYIIFCDDNCRMPSDWLEKHVSHLEQGYIVAGSWKSNISDLEYRSSIVKEPGIVSAAWLYGANFGFHIKIAEIINAFDEYLDGELGQDDIDFGIRAERKGYKIMYDPSCYVEYDYTDHGLLMAFDKDPNSDYWKDYSIDNIENDFKPVNLMLKDGKEHFSNEFAMQELLEQKERFWTRGNVIDIKGSREIWKSGIYSIDKFYKMIESWVDFNPRDWRDNKLISDKLEETR